METVLFRIAQEALTNVVRHSHATMVKVRLVQEQDWLLLQVADNGRGFDPFASSSPDGKGYGLRGMQERVNILQGEFHIQTAPGRGTIVTVRVPYSRVEVAHVQAANSPS